MEALSDSLMALARGMKQTQQRQDERMQALIHSLERKERPANKLEPIKIPEYKEGEDIEDFLEQFESKMQLREVDRSTGWRTWQMCWVERQEKPVGRSTIPSLPTPK